MDVAPIEWELLRNLGIALFIGALVGVDRERSVARDRPYFGGLRTFMLIALAGALAGWLSPVLDTPLVAVGLFGLVLLLGVSYAVTKSRDGTESVGLTGEVAAVIVYLLGAASLVGYPGFAVVGAIVTSGLLAFKVPLHQIVSKIGEEDLAAALKLLFATFIVLPVLPSEPLDPWGVLAPYRLWWFVVLISGLSFLGYVAVRWFGEHRGLLLTGFFGGLASSTAVTISTARQSRAGGNASALAMAALVSWTVMFARVVLVVAAIEAPLLMEVGAPLVAMGITSAVAALLSARTPGADAGETSLSNPFSLVAASQMGALFALTTVAVEGGRRYLPEDALYGIAALGGLVDVDAITVSMAQFAGDGLAGAVAGRAIIVATAANTVVKAGIIAALGTREMARRMGTAAAAIVGVGGVVACFA